MAVAAVAFVVAGLDEVAAAVRLDGVGCGGDERVDGGIDAGDALECLVGAGTGDAMVAWL